MESTLTRVLLKDVEGKLIVVCSKCGDIKRPDRPSAVTRYMNASCGACSHGKAVYKGHQRNKDANKQALKTLSRLTGLDLSQLNIAD